ncbi:PREDICTED: pre-mRNA-splicing factor 38B-like [Dufourea novaeangliae]|uniref:H15 domain-containing protein n=1 Tax=Dufourea novaeangliae TaxID=178035 RepID=A0A154PIP3_DUFNO|nr:PREDICTED: pre-mRNA-splicing factor 38B-like [Dufourea novaeangliae]KZC11354.1 hypothetical protein WN55_02588 [Dufourea novaeangliae]
MAHPSNPRLMNRVLDAVMRLCEGKGSTARDVLDFLQQTSKSTQRNLTMQVRRALKHAVNAGLLRHRSGRYKALFTLKPAPVKLSTDEANDENSIERPSGGHNADQPSRKVSSDRKDKSRGKRKTQRNERKRKRSRGRPRKRRRQSDSSRSDSPMERMETIQKFKYKEEKYRLPRRKVSDSKMKAYIENTGPFSNRNTAKTKVRDEESYSNNSDSDYEDRRSKVNKRATARQECKHNESGKASRRSASRNRSPQRQQSQQLQPKRSRNDMKSSKPDSDDRRDDDRNDSPVQEKGHEPNNSGSGSTL